MGGGSIHAAQWALSGKRKINDQVALLEGYKKALDMSLTTIDL